MVALVELAAQTAGDGLGELDHLVVGETGLESGARDNRDNGRDASSELGKVDHGERFINVDWDWKLTELCFCRCFVDVCWSVRKLE